ncbi:MAG: polyphosphate polymerase domain-containing protein [Prevotella sp.]|nr:polyphosphate polymerase domain-containing protein [Prevotella sp.]
MKAISDILNSYEPITLEEMSGIKLMNRTDTKFVTNTAMLTRLLQLAREAYRVQEINGLRIAEYYTTYFDTPDCQMFRIHHNGHTNRQKLRIRSYVDSNLNFLEVKTKNNHGRTKKKRMTMEGFNPREPRHDILFLEQDEQFRRYGEFLREHLRYDAATLEQQVENRFSRITLVNKAKTERLTIDLNLRFNHIKTRQTKDLTGIVIIELKRDGLQFSPILGMLKQLRIHPHGFSKYCIGSALTNPQLRQNRFKKRLRDINKILKEGQDRP